MLVAAGLPAAAHAQTPSDGHWVFEGSGLIYAEENRAAVVEPIGKLTRMFSNGQTLSGQLALDAMTGASPSGAVASGRVETTTSASGTVKTSTLGQLPTAPFHDLRAATELGWGVPIGTLLNLTTAAAYSREKDYQSLGGNVSTSLDLMQRLLTLSVSGGYNEDQVFPVHGTPLALSDGTVRLSGSNPKHVATGSLGLSRILTRRLMVGFEASRIRETGYLTEPYKVLSIVSADSGLEQSQITEKRPELRVRNSVTSSAVYHPGPDIVYLTYRYYWDDWGVNSHTVDLRYRHDVDAHSFWQPHLRLYTQTQADFFHFALVEGQPLPEFASADQRLGPLRSATLGLTYGFQVPDHPGQFTIRAEWIHQWGAGPSIPTGDDEQSYSLFPPLEIGTVHVGYTLQF